MKLIEGSAELYEMDIPFDIVYQIINENDISIGLIYLSYLDDNSIYIEWLEILTVFRGRGYLRKLFCELSNRYKGKEIHLQCTEELLKKYLRIGCEAHGVDSCTENYVLTYNKGQF